jgi:hypothetical protein
MTSKLKKVEPPLEPDGISADYLAKFCHISPAWLGAFFVRIGLPISESGIFDPQDLWRRIDRRIPKEPVSNAYEKLLGERDLKIIEKPKSKPENNIEKKKKIKSTQQSNIDIKFSPIALLRISALELFNKHSIKAKWRGTSQSQKYSVLNTSLQDGHIISVAVRASRTSLDKNSFILTAPFFPWYCFIINTPNCVILKSLDELIPRVDTLHKRTKSITIHAAESKSFEDQLEFLKQDLQRKG